MVLRRCKLRITSVLGRHHHNRHTVLVTLSLVHGWLFLEKGKFKSTKEREAVRDLVPNQYRRFEGGSRFSLLANGTEVESGTKSTNNTPVAKVNSVNESETNMPTNQFSRQAKSTRKFPSKKTAKHMLSK